MHSAMHAEQSGLGTADDRPGRLDYWPRTYSMSCREVKIGLVWNSMGQMIVV